MMFRQVRAVGAVVVAALLIAAACSSSSPKLPMGTVADARFRPADNGFPFENYGNLLSDGNAPTNLTASDVRSMSGRCRVRRRRRGDL
jgi:hypothetical protein